VRILSNGHVADDLEWPVIDTLPISVWGGKGRLCTLLSAITDMAMIVVIDRYISSLLNKITEMINSY